MIFFCVLDFCRKWRMIVKQLFFATQSAFNKQPVIPTKTQRSKRACLHNQDSQNPLLMLDHSNSKSSSHFFFFAFAILYFGFIKKWGKTISSQVYQNLGGKEMGMGGKKWELCKGIHEVLYFISKVMSLNLMWTNIF